jgi:hypothetical protein
MPLHVAPPLADLIDEIAQDLTWALSDFDVFFATH